MPPLPPTPKLQASGIQDSTRLEEGKSSVGADLELITNSPRRRFDRQ